MNSIAFRNEDQKVLWDLEIRGQLSDGYWENAKPIDHWKVWSSAETFVALANFGRNFHAKKDNYDLTAPDLLNVVGGRMLTYVRAARLFGRDNARLIAYLFTNSDTGEYTGIPLYEDPYWDTIRGQINKVCIQNNTEPHLIPNMMKEVLYNKENLLQDLRDMKGIIRTRRK